jgi:hypothetical protein
MKQIQRSDGVELTYAEQERASGRARYYRYLAVSLVKSARRRARDRGLAFDLAEHCGDLQRRIDAGVCEATGLPFQIGLGHHWASPSFDRIDAVGPYLYQNIRVVLNGFNNAIGNWGEEVLFAMVDGCRQRK